MFPVEAYSCHWKKDLFAIHPKVWGYSFWGRVSSAFELDIWRFQRTQNFEIHNLKVWDESKFRVRSTVQFSLPFSSFLIGDNFHLWDPPHEDILNQQFSSVSWTNTKHNLKSYHRTFKGFCYILWLHFLVIMKTNLIILGGLTTQSVVDGEQVDSLSWSHQQVILLYSSDMKLALMVFSLAKAGYISHVASCFPFQGTTWSDFIVLHTVIFVAKHC